MAPRGLVAPVGIVPLGGQASAGGPTMAAGGLAPDWRVLGGQAAPSGLGMGAGMGAGMAVPRAPPSQVRTGLALWPAPASRGANDVTHDEQLGRQAEQACTYARTARPFASFPPPSLPSSGRRQHERQCEQRELRRPCATAVPRVQAGSNSAFSRRALQRRGLSRDSHGGGGFFHGPGGQASPIGRTRALGLVCGFLHFCLFLPHVSTGASLYGQRDIMIPPRLLACRPRLHEDCLASFLLCFCSLCTCARRIGHCGRVFRIVAYSVIVHRVFYRARARCE